MKRREHHHGQNKGAGELHLAEDDRVDSDAVLLASVRLEDRVLAHVNDLVDGRRLHGLSLLGVRLRGRGSGACHRGGLKLDHFRHRGCDNARLRHHHSGLLHLLLLHHQSLLLAGGHLGHLDLLVYVHHALMIHFTRIFD